MDVLPVLSAIEHRLKSTIRDIPDFPKKGIIFKDITPILKDPDLCVAITEAILIQLKDLKIDVIAGIESRGFLFGLQLANRLRIPFVPIRKKGKLPYTTISQTYSLEYGEATIEMHEDALAHGARVLIHDDLLATGGTVAATSRLIQKVGGCIAGYSFIISLDFLNGKNQLLPYSQAIYSLVRY